MNPDCLAFGNHSSEFTTTDLQKIGTTNAYKISWSFERDIKDMAEETWIRTKEAIVALDKNNENTYGNHSSELTTMEL